MFEIGWSELLLVGIVALLVLGPDEFPRALRTMGQWIKKLKDTANSVQSQVKDAIKEVDITSDIKSTSSTLADALPENPLQGLDFFGDDMAKTWNAHILAAEAPKVEAVDKSTNLEKSHSEKPRVRIKAQRGKRTKAVKTEEAHSEIAS